jgi:DNA-binding CsgD family transcriptional regulator
MTATGSPAFRGRTREREELNRVLDKVRGGESAVLVLRGEAGIGKTALLQYLAQQASDCRVAQVAGVESELELPFAALHQLCAPMLGGLGALPDPQEHALRIAFGMATGSVPDRFVIGLAVLGLFAEIAREHPLVCLVDDAQWLDEASQQVLGVAGRRLLAESVLLVFAVRESAEQRLILGVPELIVEGLTDDDARGLVTAAIPGHLDQRVRDRLVDETHGNPLALLELVRGMSEAELAGGFAATSVAALPGQLQEHYVSLVRDLPEPTQRLMLLAAADPTGDATLLWRAAQALGLERDAAAPAEAEQLLEIRSGVRFRHPLVRSAAYAAASDGDRQAAHMELAAATDTDRDPERRVWHLAAAATGPDEAVACALEESADRVQARAGLAGAAAFLQRSVALTPEPARRADRALAAAHAHLHAGAFEAGLGMLAEAEADAVDDLQRARVEQLRGQINRASTSGGEAPALLLRAATRLGPLDGRLAREACLEAWGAALVAGRLANPGGHLLDVSGAARSSVPVAKDPAPGDHLLDGLATVILDGPAEASASLRQAVGAFLNDQVSTDQWLHWGVLAANAALALWDFHAWAEVGSRHVERARVSGALAPLVSALNVHRVVLIWSGDIEAASELGVEEEVVKEVTGTRRASYGDLFLAAYQGLPERAAPLIAGTAREALARGEGLGLQITDRAAAILHTGLGHYSEALPAAQRAAEGNYGPFTAQALPDLVEAAARTGDGETAADALRRLQVAVAVDDSDWAAGLEARSRAVLAEGTAAEGSYLDAVERLGRTPLRPELARTQLLYGEWLRREGRRVDARRQLHAAFELFAAMGFEAFAERTRRELLATGEKIRKREVDTLNDLTPQEEHIARLARAGRTNPEIGAELFISARTVEWHLRKVFAKLGITSRRGLREALPPRGRTSPDLT